MQFLPVDILSEARKEKMKQLDSELKEVVGGSQIGERIICPRCQYINKKNHRGTAVIYPDSIKCFACGLWRKL